MARSKEQELLDTVGAIYQAGLEPHLWPEAIHRIRQTCKADSAFMLSLDVTADQGGLQALSNVDPAIFSPQLHAVLVDNPFVRAWESKGAPSGQLFRAWDLVKREEVEKWNMYAAWARPLNFHWTIATIVYEQQPFLTPRNNLNVLRNESSPNFDEREVHTMQMLMPHLQRSLLIHWRLKFHERKERAAQQVLDRLAIAVLLLDHNGKVVIMNRMAERLAREGKALKIQRDQVSALLPDESGALRGLIAQVAETGMGKGTYSGGTVQLHDGGSSDPLLVLATPLLTERIDARWLGPGVCAALFISEPGAKHPLSVELLEQWFGFTEAEAQVAVDLMNGFDTEEISARRQVSQDTVRTQTKAVYEKTGVSRRAQLVKLLLTSPAALVKPSRVSPAAPN